LDRLWQVNLRRAVDDDDQTPAADHMLIKHLPKEMIDDGRILTKGPIERS
jgi:hypothetical protein